MKVLTKTIFILILFTGFTCKIQAQISAASFFTSENKIVVTFVDDIEKVDGKIPALDAQNRLKISCPLIYYRLENGQRVFLDCDAFLTGINKIDLINFRTLLDNQNINLASLANKPETFIQWESIKFKGQPKAIALSTKTKLGTTSNNPPFIIKVSFQEDSKGQISVTPQGISAEDIIKVFGLNPSSIKVLYAFSTNDPALDFETSVTDITCADSTTNSPCKEDGGRVSQNLIFKLKDALPIRPEKYTVIVNIPWEKLREAEQTGKIILQPNYKLPPLEDIKKDFLAGTASIKLFPIKPERGKSEYAFEGGFTSIVNPSNGKRNNVGIFGLTIKPFVPIKSFGVSRESTGNNGWLAFRPLFIADVDTQKVTQSKSPNRIQFGADFEWGTNFGLDIDEAGVTVNKNFLRQLIWTNGLRYDSDRDFKLQTMYWRTEVAFGFRNFDQSFDQRLFRYGLEQKECEKKAQEECDDKNIKNCASTKIERCGIQKEQFVSSYYVRPSVGYELGGTIRRDARSFNAPTKNISRAFFHLAMGIEFKRIVKFSIDDNYYYLQNASRRNNRNYLEAMFELNVSRLSGIEINGFSNSIFLKFQRGDLAPTFAPVNAFSMGFKIYK